MEKLIMAMKNQMQEKPIDLMEGFVDGIFNYSFK